LGLTLDIRDDDDENFTFSAREKDDGQCDREFKGEIDYVAIYDPDATGEVDPDGIVDGEDNVHTIDITYEVDPEDDHIDAGDAVLLGEAPNDDIVDAPGGNFDILFGRDAMIPSGAVRATT